MPCIISLIADYKNASGVCSDSINNRGGYPVSDTPCEYNGIDVYGNPFITKGLCSNATESLLLEEDCKDYVSNNKREILTTLWWGLISSMCTKDTWDAFISSSDDNGRLIPIDFVYDDEDGDGSYAHGPISDLENTRHRYSWICSFRLKSEDKRHLCGATLLSMPPSKTVLVSAAHCVTVCRSKAKNMIVPNCCCQNVGGEMCLDNPDCGDDAEIVNMTGDDSEIICGEWETGETAPSESGEVYNIILPIKNILRHPDYTISRGELNSQFVANDLAVFFVDDEELKQAQDKIVPICLPSTEHQSPTAAVHSGWSAPPPIDFLTQNLPGYEPYYQQFFKQWHYAMNITKCQDPDFNYKFPSNSSYPPGVLCAVEKWNEFCPSSGESGSPLMYKQNDKLTVAGLQSFTKGCSVFNYNSYSKVTYMIQESLNPSVYMKIFCYLPWIAEQYGLEYEGYINKDPDCITGTGDINEVTADTCTVIPTTYKANIFDLIDPVEAECLIPFTVDNRKSNGCLVSGIQDFTHPVFKCAMRSIKNRTTTYYTNYNGTYGEQYNEVVNAVYCPTNSDGADINSGVVSYFFNSDGPVFGPNGEYELDPENYQCTDGYRIYGLPVFGTCKNNCRGGKIKV